MSFAATTTTSQALAPEQPKELIDIAIALYKTFTEVDRASSAFHRLTVEERVFERLLKHVHSLPRGEADFLVTRFTDRGGYFQILRYGECGNTLEGYQTAAISYLQKYPECSLAAALLNVELSGQPQIRMRAINDMKAEIIKKMGPITDLTSPEYELTGNLE